MQTFTLDMNSVFALYENRAAASAVRRLVAAHEAGLADVAVAAVMPSDKQDGRGAVESFEQFRDRLRRLGLWRLGLALPPRYYDISFFDASVRMDEKGARLDRDLHRAICPAVAFDLDDVCAAHGLTGASQAWTADARRWRAAKCDVLALWSHIVGGRDVFVTTDGLFFDRSKHAALIAAGANRIARPEAAADLLSGR